MAGRGGAWARILYAPVTLWALLSLPAAYWLYAYSRGDLFYGELLHASGVLAVRLLIVAMAVTPLAAIFPGAGWVRWLKPRRRYLGVAAFGYSLLHALVYLQRKADPVLILEEAGSAGMWTGWVALIIMLALAISSNDTSVRALGRNWKRLHRLVYLAAALSFIHWVLTAFNPVSGYVHLGCLVILDSIRLWKLR